MMDTAIEATRDAGTAAKLRGIGVDTSSGDANKILASMIPALREFEHTHKGENEDAIWAGRHLEQLQGAAMSLARAGDKEVQAIPGQVERDAAPGHGAISGKALKDQQDAALASGRLRNNWEAKKLTATAPLAEKMANEEEKAQEKIDDLATAAENAALKLSQMTRGYSTLFLGIATALSPLLSGLGAKGGKSLLSFLAGNAGKATGIGVRTLGPLSALLALGGDTPQKQPEFKEWDELVAHYKKRTGASSGWGINEEEERRFVQQEAHKGNTSLSPHQQRENPVAPSTASSQPYLTPSNTPQAAPENTAPPTVANAGIPDFDRLTGAVAMTESGGNPNAHSNKGAMGLMQLMPATARGAHVKDPYDTHQSWEAGEKILKQLSQHYHGDMEKTLAAYNWGQGHLDNDISRRGANWKQELPKETADYIPRVLQNLARGTVVKIENYSGQNVAISARQASIL